MFFNKYKKYSKELAITAFGLLWRPDLATNLGFISIANDITEILEALPPELLNDRLYDEQKGFRFRLDLSLLTLFLAMYAINLSVDEVKAKKIIDPMREYFLDMFKTDYSKVKIKGQFEQQHIILGDFIKRESEQKLVKAEIESIIHKKYGMDIMRMDCYSVLDLFYPIRIAGYKQAIETQGNMGPMFSLAREFSRHFTGNENDEENGWLVIPLSLLFSKILSVFIEYCKHNFFKK